MKPRIKNSLGLLLGWLGMISPCQSHISYVSRDLGSLDPLHPQVVVLSSQTVTSDFGWASGTDPNLGDSHKLRAFKFFLSNPGDLQIRVEGLSFIKGSLPISPLLRPAFSVYQGLAHEAPAALDHDSSVISALYNDTAYGVGNWQGSFRSLGDWKIGNDDGSSFSDLSSFTHVGHAADGSAANYGAAAGIFGDGNADGMVVRTLSLNSGFYSLFIGGAQYYDLLNTGGDATGSYGFSVTLTTIPEPSSSGLFVASAALALVLRRRFSSGRSSTP
ncbi:MAG: PEP-CTERM sorting domain-containing protein [Verrucomicrobia bacterium]|nr:PEP-CTERM sorting domain-containing protein [Verrucomicrobiota bacterium]